MDTVCNPDGAGACSINTARIRFMAGDLVGAYRSALPAAEAGDRESVALLADICARAGDDERTRFWRSRPPVQAPA